MNFRKNSEPPKANLTDLDSRILKTRKGWVQGYNAQAVSDTQTQVIVACDVTQQENDVRQLKPMLENCLDQAGKLPKELVADAGYWSQENAKIENDGPKLFIATTKDWKQRKALAEAGAPKGRIPSNLNIKEWMERKRYAPKPCVT